MFYREAGQFKSTYAADMAVFPLREDRIGLAVIIVGAYSLALTGNSFLLQAVMIPFLVFSLASIGLNLLTGYTGLLSLGTGAFMGVGAYACYKLTTIFPNINIIICILASGFSPPLSACCSGYRRSASRVSISPSRRLLPSSFCNGVLFAYLGWSTTTFLERSKRLCARCSVCLSSGRPRRRKPATWSC